MVRSNDIARKAVTDSFQLSADYVEKKCRPCIKCRYRYQCGHQFSEETFYKRWLEPGVKKFTSPTPRASNFHIWASWNNQLYAWRASKKKKLDIDKLVNIRVSTYIHICYMFFNQQQCFIYSTTSFLLKLLLYI
jgi:hypothetical protein